MVHRLNHKRVAGRPVVASTGNQPDAHRVAPGHEPIPVVLDFVNPVGAGRRLCRLGMGGQGSMKVARSVARHSRIRSIDIPLT